MLLEDFTVRQVPKYAILSHTWTEEELTLQEFTCQNNGTAKKAGFAKIAQTCKLARAHHIRYVWVDTCCIDKTSSAELAEAINSMFQWYKNALVCYAYLPDLPQRAELVDESPVSSYDELKVCKWFTRGWTLQELIAPQTVHFYDQTWTFRGSKGDLTTAILRITRINQLVLQDSAQLAKLSVAERMTWASGRKTTRIEDTAYCLLGIFDINMPLLYGEGNKAFSRLQQEIIKVNSDLSIFSWSPQESVISVNWHPGLNKGCQVDCGHRDRFSSVLAPSPNGFVAPASWDILESVEHSITNRGIKIYCSLLELCLEGCYFYDCRCCSCCRKYVLIIGRTTAGSCSWGIVLDKWNPDVFIKTRKQLIRLEGRVQFFASSTRHRPIYLLLQAPVSAPPLTSFPLRIKEGTRFVIYDATPDYRWNSAGRYWYLEDFPHQWGMVSLKFPSLKDHGGACVLFAASSLDVCVLDPVTYKREIGLVSYSSSKLSWQDVFDVFRGPDLYNYWIGLDERTVSNQELKVRAKLRTGWFEDARLEVWIEESEGNGNSSH